MFSQGGSVCGEDITTTSWQGEEYQASILIDIRIEEKRIYR